MTHTFPTRSSSALRTRHRDGRGRRRIAAGLNRRGKGFTQEFAAGREVYPAIRRQFQGVPRPREALRLKAARSGAEPCSIADSVDTALTCSPQPARGRPPAVAGWSRNTPTRGRSLSEEPATAVQTAAPRTAPHTTPQN